MTTSISVWMPGDGDPTGAPKPWNESGPGTYTDGNDPWRRLSHVPSGSASLWQRYAVASDSEVSGPARPASNLELQTRIRGVSQTPGWAGDNAIGLMLSDGNRVIGLTIGDSLLWVDFNSGNTISVASDSHPWLTSADVILRKDGSARWQVWVDGRLVDELPYDRGTTAVDKRTFGAVGVIDASATAVVEVAHLELALDASVAPLGTVDRIESRMLAGITRNRLLRSMVWTIVGTFQPVVRQLTDFWFNLTSGAVTDFELRYAGDQLPDDEDPDWTTYNGPAQSVVRERVRFTSDGLGGGSIAAEATPAPAVAYRTTAEFRLACTWKMKAGWTPDADGRVGPAMQIVALGKVLTAQLVEDAEGPAWVATDAVFSGAFTPITDRRWYVNPLVEHRVEIVLIGTTWGILFVDEYPVDQFRWGELPTGGGADKLTILVNNVPGSPPACEADTRNALAQVRYHDEAHRPLLVTSAIERTLHVGGCERNATIGHWSERMVYVQPLRATTIGILMELARITCENRHELATDSAPASWYLEESWPELTPVFAEVEGYIKDVFVEIYAGSVPPNFTLDGLVQIIRRYLVAVSTAGLEYHIALAAKITAPVPAAALGLITCTVHSTDGFEAGDSVTIRDSGNTVSYDTTIDNIPTIPPNTLVLVDPGGSWGTGDTIRKLLATT